MDGGSGIIGATFAGDADFALGYVSEDPNTLEELFIGTNSGRMESLSFVAPYAYTMDWLTMFSDKSKVLTIAIVTTVGVVVGSALYALASRSFR